MALSAEPNRLRVHQLALDLAVAGIEIASGFRGPGATARADQLVRAAMSIPSNIAEACGRGTVAEFRRFLLYARGSAQEMLTQLRLARRLQHASSPKILKVEGGVVLVLKMLTRLYDHPPPDR
jgi:four helix bundle protein